MRRVFFRPKEKKTKLRADSGYGGRAPTHGDDVRAVCAGHFFARSAFPFPEGRVPFSRGSAAGLMTEWNAFAAFAVDWLGMPVEALPLYSVDACWKKKAAKIKDFVLEVGNFGHKQRRDYRGMSYIKRKCVSAWERLSDMLRHFPLFPKESIVFFGGVLQSGLYAAAHGE